MKTKKILSILLALIMMAAVMAGCTTKEAGKSSSPSSTAGDSSVSVADTDSSADSSVDSGTDTGSGEVPTLVWWLIGNQPANLKDGVDQINEYTEKEYGVKLDIKMGGYGDYNEKTKTVVNTGENFDIMFVDAGTYNKYVKVGAFLDITELAKTETPELYDFIPEKVWKGTFIDEKCYSIPTYKDSSLTQYYVYDNEMVEKYNIDISSISSIKELAPVLKTMKEGEGSSFYPMIMLNDGVNGFLNNYDDLLTSLPPVGVRVDDANRKVVSVLEEPEIMEDLKIIHSMYNEGIINPDAPTLNDAPPYRAFFPAQAFPGAEVVYAINSGIEKYDMQQVFGPIYKTGTIQGSLNAISVNSKYPKEALKLLQAVNLDQKLRDMLGYGVEGVDFDYVSENVVKRNTDTWGIGNYAIGTFFNMSIVEGTQEDQWDQVKKLNEEATESVCLGFVFDLTPVETEIANCTATWDKYKKELFCGASNPEEMVPQIVKELNDSGMDKIMEEAQKQVDEYFS